MYFFHFHLASECSCSFSLFKPPAQTERDAMLASWLWRSKTGPLPSKGKLFVLFPPGPAGVTAKLIADCTLYCMIVAGLLMH